MPLNLQGFVGEPNQWAGLYHAADQMEKRQLKADQLAMQQQAKRNAAGTFLQNYLDPKDYLSGTQFDPMILQGLQEAMQQGSRLAAAGADSPMLMMALGPMVNKLSTYSTNAKNINKQVDDQIAKLKDSGYTGYDFAKLRDEALKSAFYKPDANGQLQLDPDQADPSVDWIGKAIETSPELVTTSRGWDEFADKAKMKTEADMVQDYDRFGTMDKRKVNLKYQEYMVPERKGGKVTGFVPKYEMANDQGQPIMHTFTNDQGQKVIDQVRVLDNDIYEGLRKDLKDQIRGQVKQHLAEYRTATGKEISPNSPQAKLVERALAYDELNRPQRNFGAIDYATIENKLSPQMISVNVQSTPQFKENLREITEIKADVRDQHKPLKTNPIETIGEIFSGNPDYLQNTIPNSPLIDVTTVFPKGGLKAGRGQNFNYRGIYFNPDTRELTVEKEGKLDMYGRKPVSTEFIKESDIGKFIYQIGEANGIGYPRIKELLKKIGYENNKFKVSEEVEMQRDIDKREKKVKAWRQITTQPLGLPFTGANQ